MRATEGARAASRKSAVKPNKEAADQGESSAKRPSKVSRAKTAVKLLTTTRSEITANNLFASLRELYCRPDELSDAGPSHSNDVSRLLFATEVISGNESLLISATEAGHVPSLMLV